MRQAQQGNKQQQSLPITLDKALQQEILGVLLIAMGAVTALALLSITKGALSEAWVMLLRRIFGWGVYLVSLVLIGGGLLLLWEDLRERFSIPARGMFGLEVLFVALLGLSHLPAAPEHGFQLADKGGGGGYIGWGISYFLITAVGRGVSFLLLLLVAALGLVLFLSLEWNTLKVALGEAKARLADLWSPPEAVEAPPAVPKKRKAHPKRARAPEPSEEVKPAPKRRRVRRLDRRLPSLDLLNGGADEAYGDADVRYQKQIIEETLENFGVPAKVVEVNQGPTITQFGVEPGFVEYTRSDGSAWRRKVKVSKIMALQNDLALALAAAPIRIEAPVPGRPVVGIEVPKPHVSLVGLRGVIESKAFRSIDSSLRIALGRNVAGRSVAADLALMPHLLIAGALAQASPCALTRLPLACCLITLPTTCV